MEVNKQMNTSEVVSAVQMRKFKLTQEEISLIDSAVAAGMVKKCQPGGVPGNEASRGTKELIAKRRREFRKLQKAGN